MSKKLKRFLSIVLVLATMCSVALIVSAGSTETKYGSIGEGALPQPIYLFGTLGVSNTGNIRHIYMASTSNIPYQYMFVDTDVYIGSTYYETVSSVTVRNATSLSDTQNLDSEFTIICKGYYAFESYGDRIYLNAYTPSRTPTQAAG